MNNLHKSLIETTTVAASLSIDKVPQVVTLIKSQDFAGPGPDVSSLFYNLGNGLELTVTAGVHSSGANANAPLNIIGSADILQKGGNKPGIGIRSGQPSDSSQLDAFSPNEFMRFSIHSI
ncbi:hypothetical protein [Dapis sp. BLCC M229]|uniref:hypothetical protein n=1 Tax=Dapis sp. BLCC M229 TaxID=3400188 RepID=UPI003CEC3627